MQYTNVIAIDPSTTCTGICINGAVSCVVSNEQSRTKKEEFTKWFEIANDVATIHTYDSPTKPKKGSSFNVTEVSKLIKYDFITDKIISIISDKSSNLTNSICLIEGYSYNSAAGNLIDLVTFSTLIKHKLIRSGSVLTIVPPAELKMCAAKLAYEPIDVGKKKSKLIWRNKENIAAGRFTKHEMYKAICENNDMKDDWAKLLRNYQSDQINARSISKPLDDINDSYILYHSYKAGYINS